MSNILSRSQYLEKLEAAIVASEEEEVKALAKYLRKSLHPEEYVSLCLYTDGGCNPPTGGIAGYGIHGYLYSDELPKQGSGAPKSVPTNYGYILKPLMVADKSMKPVFTLFRGCTQENQATPVTVTPLVYVDMCGGIDDGATNNVAEITAAINALRLAQLLGVKSAHLRIDSKQVLQGVTSWIDRWKTNGWRTATGTTVANVPHLKDLLVEMDAVNELGITVTYEWVKGHSDFLGNICADALATRGNIIAHKKDFSPVIEFKPAKGYWKESAELNGLLSEPRFYFTTAVNAGRSDYGAIYHLGSHGKNDEMIGKKMSDINNTIVILQKPDVVLEAIRDSAAKLEQRCLGHLYDCRLDVATKPSVYNEITNKGFKFMSFNPDTHFYVTAEKLPVLRVPDAPRKSFDAIDYLNGLENILCEFIEGRLPDSYKVNDITDSLYSSTTNAKGVKKTKVIEVTDSAYKVKVVNPNAVDTQLVTVTLTYGITIPRRLNLQRIADRVEKVVAVTWADGTAAFRYVTIVSTTDGEWALWAGAYNNMRIVVSK